MASEIFGVELPVYSYGIDMLRVNRDFPVGVDRIREISFIRVIGDSFNENIQPFWLL